MSIHPTAVVDPSARIDPSVEVGPCAVIGPETELGPGCLIGPHCVVEYAVLGRNNRIGPGAYVGTAPQDLKYNNEPTKLIMGSNNIVREFATLNRGTTASGKTSPFRAVQWPA